MEAQFYFVQFFIFILQRYRKGIFDAMVSSTCSSASIEAAPAGFPGLTADGAIDAFSDARKSLIVWQRPLSVEDIQADRETVSGKELMLKDVQSALSSSNWLYKNQGKNKKTAFPKLSSISRRNRYDSAYRLGSDFYPLPRWRPLRSRRVAQSGAIDLKQLSENFKEYERKNRRKSVRRFFDS